jgi:DNA-directed RNA polymerase
MTTVYGVTFVGAREQIERQLKDRGDIPSELAWNASSYLAKKVLSYLANHVPLFWFIDASLLGLEHYWRCFHRCEEYSRLAKSVCPPHHQVNPGEAPVTAERR